MDDKVTSPTETSEYKFTESEAAPTQPVADTGVSSEQRELGAAEIGRKPVLGLDFLKNVDLKRFAVPGAIVFAIMAVYFVFSFYSAKRNQIAEQSKEMLQNSAARVQQTTFPTSTAAPMVPTSMVAPAGSVNASANLSSDQMAQIQNSVEQRVNVISQQINSSRDSVANLQSSITKTQQDILAMSQKIEHLTMVTQDLVSEIEKIKVPPKSAKKKAKSPIAYHVRAIVPGRVWLESADGRSVTLRVGDQLEGYGEVLDIVPRQGMVIMSNGSVIQYGIDDF